MIKPVQIWDPLAPLGRDGAMTLTEPVALVSVLPARSGKIAASQGMTMALRHSSQAFWRCCVVHFSYQM